MIPSQALTVNNKAWQFVWFSDPPPPPPPASYAHALTHRCMFSIGGLSLLFYWLSNHTARGVSEHAGLQGCSPVSEQPDRSWPGVSQGGRNNVAQWRVCPG